MSKREVLDAIAIQLVIAERHRRQDIAAHWANGEVYQNGRVSGLIDAFIAVQFDGDRVAALVTRDALINFVAYAHDDWIEDQAQFLASPRATAQFIRCVAEARKAHRQAHEVRS